MDIFAMCTLCFVSQVPTTLPSKTGQTIDTIYEDIEFPIPSVVINQPSPAVVHPVNHDYDDVEYPSQPLASDHSTTSKATHSDTPAAAATTSTNSEPLYGVIQKRSQPQSSITTEDDAPRTDTESPQAGSAVHGYKIKKMSEVDDSDEEKTPPRTEEMNELIEDDDKESESDNYDDAIYEVVNDNHDDDDIYEVVNDNHDDDIII